MALLSVHRILHRGWAIGTDKWDHGPTCKRERRSGDLAGGETRRWLIGLGQRGYKTTQGEEANQVGGFPLRCEGRKRSAASFRHGRSSELEGEGVPAGLRPMSYATT